MTSLRKPTPTIINAKLKWIVCSLEKYKADKLVVGLVLTNLLVLRQVAPLVYFLATKNSASKVVCVVTNTFLPVLGVNLKNDPLSYFTGINDLGGYFSPVQYTSITSFNNWLTNQQTIAMVTTFGKIFFSLTSIYPSAVWLERELKELDRIWVRNLRDTRKLLHDYTLTARKYNLDWAYVTNHYDTISQELLKVMLCWSFYFLFFIATIFLSFCFLNKAFLLLLLLTEVIVVFLFLVFLTIAAVYNTTYLINLGLLLLILGGLELALAFLLLTFKC